MWFELILETRLKDSLTNNISKPIAISKDINKLKNHVSHMLITMGEKYDWKSVDLYNVHVTTFSVYTLTIRPLISLKVIE